MHSNQNNPGVDKDPFIQLLSEATEVNIEELIPEPSTKSTAPVRERRAFIVYIKPKTIPATHLDLASGNFPREYLQMNAEILLASEEYVLARNVFSFLLKDNLREPNALKGLGICLFRTGQIAAARKCFKALWELLGKEEALLWLGQCSVSEKNDDQALEYFTKITSPHFLARFERFEFHKELGNCLTRAGRYEEAAKSYQLAADVEPRSDALYVNMGMMEVQRMRAEVAATFFRKALTLNPLSSKARCGLGLVAMAENNPTSARQEFEMALDLESTNLVALYQLITLSRDPAFTAPLRRRLETFIAAEPRNGEIRFIYAADLFKAGDWKTCEVELEKILKAEPKNIHARELREELKSQKHP